jgi:hypothetical protein
VEVEFRGRHSLDEGRS